MPFTAGLVSLPLLSIHQPLPMPSFLTNPQFGGAALTSSLLYLSLALHQRNRVQQATLLRQQALLLNSIVEPLPAPMPPPRYVLANGGVAETVKHAWNEDVQAAVRWVQRVDWGKVRERAEARVVGMWRGMREG